MESVLKKNNVLKILQNISKVINGEKIREKNILKDIKAVNILYFIMLQ